MKRILALDISLCRAGVARTWYEVAGQPLIDVETVEVPPLRVPGARPGTQRNEPRTGPARLAWWRDWLIEHIAKGVEVVAVEAMAGITQQKGQHVRETCGLLCLLELVCFERDVEWVQVTPKVIKKHGTGRGDADKLRMEETARERFGEQISNEHEADAAWLCDYVYRGIGK